MGAGDPAAQATSRGLHDRDPRLQPGAALQPLQDGVAFFAGGGGGEWGRRRGLLLGRVAGEGEAANRGGSAPA